jgi:hypothetical protein
VGVGAYIPVHDLLHEALLFCCDLRLCSLFEGRKDDDWCLRVPTGVRCCKRGWPCYCSFIFEKLWEYVFSTTVLCFCFIRDVKMHL